MEPSTGGVFILFVILTGMSLYFFNREVSKPSPRYFITAILGFCALNILTLITSILIIDPGLGAFFYLFFATISLFISWFAATLIALNQYSKDQNKEKLASNIFSSFTLILGIIMIWVFVNNSGPMKIGG